MLFATGWRSIWFFRNKFMFNDEQVSSRKAGFAISPFNKNWSSPKDLEDEDIIACRLMRNRCGQSVIWALCLTM